jgi:surface polysaccharide O-acyltransferase-like enzyme
VAPLGPTPTERGSSRDRTDVELLRAVGALAVVCIHATDAAVVTGSAGGTDAYYWTALVIGGAARFAVPLFFAVAGWVLLARRPVDSEADVWRRVVRVFLPLLSWSLIYLAWPFTPPLRARAAEGALLGVPVIGHLWFLYAYIPLVLILGAITLLVQQRWPRRPWMLLGALAFASAAPSIIKLGQGFLRIQTSTSTFRLYLWVLLFAVAGAVLLSSRERMEPETTRVWGGVLLVCGTVGAIWWASWNGYAAPFAFGSVVVAAECLGVMLVVRGVELRGSAAELVRALGRASF